MKFLTLVISILPVLAAAAPAPAADTDSANAFRVMALRTGSGIHYLPMQARGSKFWLGGLPATYCPEMVENCPPGKETVILGSSSLYVQVPGGQNLYVTPEGELGFTRAHSTYVPPGAAIGGFKHVAGEPHGQWSFKGFGADGFMACPDDAENPSSWQVFAAMNNATVPTGNVKDCLTFTAAAVPYDGSFAAWQYI
ncbi:hypothetical protein VTN31DRAFT_3437 [Thermomyces dupontii]|uniref:uncharacterized protein n=1 Tax=Talaromyces thermophilus TaxID=28565 RepID=UPI0037434499